MCDQNSHGGLRVKRPCVHNVKNRQYLNILESQGIPEKRKWSGKVRDFF